MIPANPKTANELTAEIILAVQRYFPLSRLWRRNVGGAYPLAAVRSAIGLLISGQVAKGIAMLRSMRVVDFGLKGEPDIDGIFPVTVNGHTYGIRLGIEVKTAKDRMRIEQVTCREVWRRAGAIYIEGRSVDQVIEELTAFSKELP